MKRAHQILPVLVAIIFMISTNGILIYKTHCACTGNEQVSLYVMPESCVISISRRGGNSSKEFNPKCCRNSAVVL